jgi:dolichol-phosphate mannosyltransferase
MKLSIIIPLYNEEANIAQLRSRLTDITQNLPCDSEIVLINDGSKDQTLPLISAWAHEDTRVIVVNFARNFGHQAAITAGIDFTSGDAIIIMDGDLQDPPELIPKMIEKFHQGYDIVYAVRQSRTGETIFKRASAWLFYWLINKISGVNLPRNTGDFRLISRDVAHSLKSMRESHRYIRGMTTWAGMKQTSITFERQARHAGETKYTLFKMIKFAFDGIFSFSSAPLKLSVFAGVLMMLFGFGYGTYTFINAFFDETYVAGWASLIVMQSFIGGIILLNLGVVGLYVGRIYEEIKERPLYIVQDHLNVPAETLVQLPPRVVLSTHRSLSPRNYNRIAG